MMSESPESALTELHRCEICGTVVKTRKEQEIRAMITKEQYIEFLSSTPINYTCTHLADHLSGISHDSIPDFWRSQRLTAQSV